MKTKKIIIYIIICLFIIVAILFHIIISQTESLTEHEKKPFDLGIIVQIKNEGMVIDEWIQHYLWQGVQKFYIIDNDSTDNTVEVLKPYSDVIQYFFMPEKYSQEKNYNTVLNDYAKQECEWLLICDADEYIYNTTNNKTIVDYLLELDSDEVNQISIPWKMFGSSDFDKQPSNIRKSFTQRKKDVDNENSKSIVKTTFVNELSVHTKGHSFLSGNTTFENEKLNLNHYAIMSKEYYEKIKMTRGDVNHPQYENVRDWNYFNSYDFKEVIDTTLADMVD